MPSRTLRLEPSNDSDYELIQAVGADFIEDLKDVLHVNELLAAHPELRVVEQGLDEVIPNDETKLRLC